MNRSCVCLICFKPNDIWVNFLSKFIKYNVYIIIDDNSKDYREDYSKFKNINIVQIIDDDCRKNGVINMNFLILRKDVSGWEKAVYYFSFVNTVYDNVWFFEDDVFFYSEKTLLDIDSNYNKCDLLSNFYTENTCGNKTSWHWNKIDIKFSPPYYYAMVCCIRLSSDLLLRIKDYANKYNTLFFLEALFPTLCKKYDLQYNTPYQFRNIIWRKNYIDTDLDRSGLFHPIKNTMKHEYYRNIIP